MNAIYGSFAPVLTPFAADRLCRALEAAPRFG